MKIKIKKLILEAVIPTYATNGSAGMDLTATSKGYDEYGNINYGVGLAIEIPKGYVGLLFPRGSNSKQDLFLTNSVGVIDSDFRGEITAKFKPSGKGYDIPLHSYSIGDRIAQLIIIPYPQIEFEEVEKLSKTDRGANGYGSTGK